MDNIFNFRKAVVTGSSGFIGWRLVEVLKTFGVEVIEIDRKIGREAKDISKYMTDDVDVVFHLAAQTSVFNTDQEQIVKDNIEAFIAVVDACRQYYKPPKLVYASSSTAYEHNTTSLYGISKRFDEEYARRYLPTATGVRLHNVYGPNPRQGTLLWHLLNEDKVTLYNKGQNVRHFTFVDDALAGLIGAYWYDTRLINIANPESATTLRFAQLVKKYRPNLEIEVSEEMRDLDREVQAIDPGVPTPHGVDYVTLEKGILSCWEVHQRS